MKQEVSKYYKEKGYSVSEKVAKSMLAMAMISQLMPYYGGRITDKEWRIPYDHVIKYTIIRKNGEMQKDFTWTDFTFLAFHTEDQRDKFLKYNERLVKDYLMID